MAFKACKKNDGGHTDSVVCLWLLFISGIHGKRRGQGTGGRGIKSVQKAVSGRVHNILGVYAQGKSTHGKSRKCIPDLKGTVGKALL